MGKALIHGGRALKTPTHLPQQASERNLAMTNASIPASSAQIKTRAILFSAPMIRALIEGCKTQTRRVVKKAEKLPPSPESFQHNGWAFFKDYAGGVYSHPFRCPYGAPRDLLWVRETWCPVDDRPCSGEHWIDYRATPKYDESHPAGWHEAPDDAEALKWRPSIHMPRRVSRLTLEISDTRVQRLQDISEDDARCRFLKPHPCGFPVIEK
jgi:hypothetical protein